MKCELFIIFFAKKRELYEKEKKSKKKVTRVGFPSTQVLGRMHSALWHVKYGFAGNFEQELPSVDAAHEPVKQSGNAVSSRRMQVLFFQPARVARQRLSGSNVSQVGPPLKQHDEAH